MSENEYREHVVDFMKAMIGGSPSSSGPTGIEMLAVALGGGEDGKSLADPLYAIAAALDRIADHLEGQNQ